MSNETSSSEVRAAEPADGFAALVEALPRRRAGLWGGALLIVALLAGSAWWLSQPSYGPLLKGLSGDKHAQVIALLAQWQVPHSVDDTGVILAPAERVAELRARLAAHGLPGRERVGLELFGQGDQGMSEFAQRINYQRALEGELERTIQALDEIRSARVHLTLGKSSIFDNRREPAKGSVTLHLKPERALTSEQIAGIQQLVAAAVTDMAPEHVVVLDDLGRPLAAAGEAASEVARANLPTQLEAAYQERAQRLIAGLLPGVDVRLSVRLQVNLDKVTTVKESLIPAADGDAGFLLKRRGPAPNDAAHKGDPNGEYEYAYGRERAEIQRTPGVVERLHVGVVVGRVLSDELARSIESVLIAGLGISREQGDTLAVVGAIASPAADGASIPVSDPRPAEVVAATDAAPLRGALWPMLLANGLGVALLIAGVVLLRRARRASSAPRALSYDERQQLLAEARRWLGAAA